MGSILANGGKTVAGSGFSFVFTGFRNLYPFVDPHLGLETCLTLMAVKAIICLASPVGLERGRF
jgi:hypothetical protein